MKNRKSDFNGVFTYNELLRAFYTIDPHDIDNRYLKETFQTWIYNCFSDYALETYRRNAYGYIY